MLRLLTCYLGPQLTQIGFQHKNAQDAAQADKPFYAVPWAKHVKSDHIEKGMWHIGKVNWKWHVKGVHISCKSSTESFRMQQAHISVLIHSCTHRQTGRYWVWIPVPSSSRGIVMDGHTVMGRVSTDSMWIRNIMEMWILVGTITAPCTRSLPWYFLLHISKINSAQTHMLVCGQQRHSIIDILFVWTTLHLHAAKWIDRNCKLLKRCQQNRFKTVSRCPWMFLGTSRDLQGLNGTHRRCIAAAASCTDYHLWVILCKICTSLRDLRLNYAFREFLR